MSIDLISSILSIGKIHTLDLSGNQLSSLPGYLIGLQNLKELRLEGNPLISPSPEVVSAGAEVVLAYLKKPFKKRDLVRVFDRVNDRNVEVLDLSARKIGKIPREIWFKM